MMVTCLLCATLASPVLPATSSEDLVLCRNDADCPGGRACADGKCWPRCRAEADCEGSSICYRGACRPIAPVDVTAADLAAAELRRHELERAIQTPPGSGLRGAGIMFLIIGGVVATFGLFTPVPLDLIPTMIGVSIAGGVVAVFGLTVFSVGTAYLRR